MASAGSAAPTIGIPAHPSHTAQTASAPALLVVEVELRSPLRMALPLALAAVILILFGRKRVSMPVRAVGIVLAVAVLFFTLSYWLRPLLAALGGR